MLFHAMIITQTIALIFSQIDQNKIQNHLPIGHFLFTFPLLWKYKTDSSWRLPRKVNFGP